MYLHIDWCTNYVCLESIVKHFDFIDFKQVDKLEQSGDYATILWGKLINRDQQADDIIDKLCIEDIKPFQLDDISLK